MALAAAPVGQKYPAAVQDAAGWEARPVAAQGEVVQGVGAALPPLQ